MPVTPNTGPKARHLHDKDGRGISSTTTSDANIQPLDVTLRSAVDGSPITTQEVSIVGTNEVPTYATASVTTSSTAILGSPSGQRVLQAVQNLSDTVIWLKDDGSAAVVNQGIALVPYGVYYVTVPENVPQQGVVGIHNSTGSKTVSGWYIDVV